MKTSENQKRELSCPMMTAEPNRETKDCFPGEDSANKKSWILGSLQPSQLSFPSREVFSFPCVGTCVWFSVVTDARLKILCWSQINVYLREEYSVVYLFQIDTNKGENMQNLWFITFSLRSASTHAPKHAHENVHISTILNSPKLET